MHTHSREKSFLFCKVYREYFGRLLHLRDKLKEHHSSLVDEIIEGKPGHSISLDGLNLNSQTLCEIKALIIGVKILHGMYKKANPKLVTDNFTLKDFEKAPGVIDIRVVRDSMDDLKDFIENDLQDVSANLTVGEKVLDFLKSFINVLVMIVTFGYKKNVLTTNTFYLENLKETRQELHDIANLIDLNSYDSKMVFNVIEPITV